MKGKPFISFIHPDDIDKTNKEVAKNLIHKKQLVLKIDTVK
jgi:hypothetical protein